MKARSPERANAFDADHPITCRTIPDRKFRKTIVHLHELAWWMGNFATVDCVILIPKWHSANVEKTS